jgi:hypothetical protein
METDAFATCFSEYPYYGNTVAETLLLMALFTIWLKSY